MKRLLIVLVLLWPGLALGQSSRDRQMEKLQEQRRWDEWKLEMERQRQQQERFHFQDRMDRLRQPQANPSDLLRDYYIMDEMIRHPYRRPY